MSQGTPADIDSVAVGSCLSDVTFDLLPTEDFDEALSHLPSGSRIAVVLTPHLGMESTVERTVQARDLGHEVVPHVAARFVEDAEELDELAGRLREAGVTDVFVPGGDRDEPVGEFASACELLVALEELGYEFEEVGIGGYPTGHDAIDDGTLREAMRRKAPHATYLVTQLCFDAAAVVDWIESVRERGIDLPVEVGVPGVMEYRQLMSLARRWGIASPLEFISKTAGVFTFLRELVGSGGRYRPDDMLPTLAAARADPLYDIRRLRLYTFNQTEPTEAWRQEWLDAR
ncbi:MAG: methylenetetrahydrofolate reductase [Haloarculaceae archaeon]